MIKFKILGIETIAKDEEDISIAIQEALKSFKIVSDKFGDGFEEEFNKAINADVMATR